MNPAMRTIWLLVLVAFTGGCTAMRPAAWPGGDGTARTGDPGLPEVAAGDRVTVELLDGSKVRGGVLRITDEFLTIETSRTTGVYDDQVLAAGGAAPRTIMRDSVRALEKDVVDGARTALLVVGMAGVAGGIVALSQMQPMGGGSLFGGSSSGR